MTSSSPYLASFIFIFIFGSCIGSFLNLVIYRIPLNLSIIKPRSHCPECKNSVPIFGLIPIFGYFFLRGRCYYCKTRISFQYPLIELICGIFTFFLYCYFFNEYAFLNLLYTGKVYSSNLVSFLTTLWLFYSGIVLSLIDFKHRILPDVITLPGILIGILLSSFNPNIGWFQSLIGASVGFSGLYLLSKFYELWRKRTGMGFGDVKYLATIGSVVGCIGVFYSLFIASIIGSIVGLIYGIYSKKGLTVAIPFGPFLSIAVFCVYLFHLY